MYELRTVAFIDILGFKDALKIESRAKEILGALTQVKASINKYYDQPIRNQLEGIFDIELSAFSDSVVISGIESQTVVVLSCVLEFSQMLLECGFLCRGAIAFGRLYHRDGILFGDGLIEAYRREKNQAVYPRVILDRRVSDILADSKNSPGDFDGLIRKDKDGQLFINILYETKQTARDIRGILSALVCGQLTNRHPIECAVEQKLLWLVNEYDLCAAPLNTYIA